MKQFLTTFWHWLFCIPPQHEKEEPRLPKNYYERLKRMER